MHVVSLSLADHQWQDVYDHYFSRVIDSQRIAKVAEEPEPRLRHLFD